MCLYLTCYRLDRVELLTVGEAFDDLIFAGLPRLPRPGEELRVPTFGRTSGGGAIITAVAAARLGVRVGVLSAVSDTAVGTVQRERARLINLKRPSEDAAVSVSLSTRRNRAFVTFEGVNLQLETRLLAKLRRSPTARHVHFALSPASCRAWLGVVERMRDRGTTTSWDFGWNERLLEDRAFSALASAVDWLFVNESEAKLYTRAPTLALARRILRTLGTKTVLKLGSRGAALISSDRAVRQPAMQATVVDTTGAGDAFNAGFLAAVIRGRDAGDALRLASYIAARSIEGLGGIQSLPHARELPRWCKRCLEAA